MKNCSTCDQPLAEGIYTCPSCGSDVGEGRLYIDDYRIIKVLHEGHASLLCHAVRERTGEEVMIRLFTPGSGVTQEIADRLGREIELLKKLPEKDFVKHHAIRRSSEGLWYRISEWVNAENWSDLAGSGELSDYRVAIDLFKKITSILTTLHKSGHFIPHLILDDIIVVRNAAGELDVKIDYKLSRFLDPKMDRPGPMLKHLLDCHPDIINQRPLDLRSDIWSLGKIFVELLTADFESYNYLSKIDPLALPVEVKTLFKMMLANEPILRPRSMKEVAEKLGQVTDYQLKAAGRAQLTMAATTEKTISMLQKRQVVLIMALMVILAGVILGWFQLNLKKQDSANVLEGYANKYSRSVAFVLVEYWLKTGETVHYRDRSEGTAFLVDKEGYLMTNRHVACPWLEDNDFFMTFYQLKMSGLEPSFGYRMFLWFEGEKAFNRSAKLMEQADLSDQYALNSSFRSDGKPHLTIAGVAKPPVQTRQLVFSPLKDDFAVLKIDQVPPGREPLPLDLKMESMKIAKLAPVITLGFPLGSNTQEASVNVSVTRGHVRRSFEDLLQVDASLYGGNSGGPLIDMNGKTIGIVSGVAIDRSEGLVPIEKPIWDMAMVLPITKAAQFLQEIKNGRLKWNGILDFSTEVKIKGIISKAQQGRWAEAMKLADKALEKSKDPSLLTIGGMMHFCAADYSGAKLLFQQCISMEAQKELAELMLFIMDWQEGKTKDSPYWQGLLDLDWRSEAEFLGYLAQVLEGSVSEPEALNAWESQDEKSWIYFITGLIQRKKGDLPIAEKRLQEALLAASSSTWEYFLAQVALEDVQKKILDSLSKDRKKWSQYQSQIASFEEQARLDQEKKKQSSQELNVLASELETKKTATEKLKIFEKISAILSDNGEVILELAYYSAIEESWEKALEYADRLMNREGRQSATRLRLGLLKASVLYKLGRENEARSMLEKHYRLTGNTWYRSIDEYMLGKKSEAQLRKETAESPEKLLIAHTAMGFWAEAGGEKENAIEHYKEALESFMDNWVEFNFARERIKKLRTP